MTIVKKGSWINRGNSPSDVPVRRSTGKPVGNGRSFRVSSSDSSDSELLEPINGHLCQVGDQVCELPFELFDAPDLTEILSLETWNHVLNDEDREALAAYLPCMDEDTYRSTLKALLGGESFNFGSPLVNLFQMLKSGECNPKAVRYRDAHTCLQRREHQHKVRAYHNGMVNSFFEMQNLWRDCPESNLTERLEMWTAWKVKGVRLTPQFLAEKRGGPLQNHHYKSLLKRKECYMKAKEDALAAQLMPPNLTPPDADSKVYGPPRKLKREMDPNVYNGFLSATEIGKKTGPKGVLKLLPKPLGRINASMEMAPFNEFTKIPPPYPEAESSFEDKLFGSSDGLEPTVSPSVDWSSASPVTEKVAFKQKPESRVKAAGSKKFPRQSNENAVGSYNRDVAGGTNAEQQELVDLTCDAAIHEAEGVTFSAIATEEMQLSPSGFNQQGANEPKSKIKKKSKPKHSESAENEGARVLFEVNSAEDAYLAEKEVHDILDDKDEPDTVGKPPKRRRKKPKAADDSPLPASSNLNEREKFSAAKVSRKLPASVPPIVMSFPFSTIHLLSAVRTALTTFSKEQLMAFERENMFTDHSMTDEDFLVRSKTMYLQQDGLPLQGDDLLEKSKDLEEKSSTLPSVPLHDIVEKVQANPGDPRILETQEPLQGLIRGVLKVLSSRTSHPGMKGWKPLVIYNRAARGWSWIGPSSLLSQQAKDMDNTFVPISAEVWMIPPRMLYKLQELFGNWLKHEQEILQQLGQLALAPPLATPMLLDEKERFRELRAQKSLITINPTSEEMRAYFRREEALRYSVPDRAFSYTCLDGRKSVVAPLRRTGGKPNSKARDHFMLKPDRPPHVTILCLVRDAAARLPGSIGTRADVCSLIRDSQYIVEDVSDVQLNHVVSGALDRLHYERDPCVRFDGDRKLWVYLHTDKEDEDFEDDATSSTKRWRRTKKDGTENSEFCLPQEYDYLGKDDQDSSGLGLDFSPTSCFGGPSDLSSVYSSAGRNDISYTHPHASLTSPLALESAFSASGREDSLLHFIELPPSIQPPCVNMQQSHPMGWEVLSNRWEQDVPFQSQDQFVQEDYGALTSMASSHRESEVLIDGGI